MFSAISHNQGLITAAVVAVCLLFWSYGCESKVQSLVGKTQVTRSQLTIELNEQAKLLETQLDTLKAQAADRFQQLDNKDAIKAKVFDAVSVATNTGGFNTVGLLTLAGSVLGLGAVVDNRIKDKVIKNRPLPTPPTPPTT
jgi:hypothetical protein